MQLLSTSSGRYSAWSPITTYVGILYYIRTSTTYNTIQNSVQTQLSLRNPIFCCTASRRKKLEVVHARMRKGTQNRANQEQRSIRSIRVSCQAPIYPLSKLLGLFVKLSLNLRDTLNIEVTSCFKFSAWLVSTSQRFALTLWKHWIQGGSEELLSAGNREKRMDAKKTTK